MDESTLIKQKQKVIRADTFLKDILRKKINTNLEKEGTSQESKELENYEGAENESTNRNLEREGTSQELEELKNSKGAENESNRITDNNHLRQDNENKTNKSLVKEKDRKLEVQNPDQNQEKTLKSLRVENSSLKELVDDLKLQNKEITNLNVELQRNVISNVQELLHKLNFTDGVPPLTFTLILENEMVKM